MKKVECFGFSESNIFNNIELKKIFVSIVLFLLISIISIILMAVVVTYTNFNLISALSITNVIIYVYSYLTGFFSALGTKKYGWLNGVISGGIFALVVVACKLIFGSSTILVFKTLGSLLLCLILGMFGGITAVNLKSRKR